MIKTVNKDVVLGLKMGDTRSFSKIYHCYYSNIFHFSYKLLKSEQDAEDITQNLFMKIWEQRDLINEDLNFKSYLFQIARNDIYNMFKKRVNSLKFYNYVLQSESQQAECDLKFENLNMLDYIKSIINNFPPQQKLILTLYKIEGYSHNEIAQMLNLSVRTIENNVFRSLKKLRNNLNFSLN
jgi:RNA polymerase sigma-70 factor, ECF subfamily